MTLAEDDANQHGCTRCQWHSICCRLGRDCDKMEQVTSSFLWLAVIRWRRAYVVFQLLMQSSQLRAGRIQACVITRTGDTGISQGPAAVNTQRIGAARLIVSFTRQANA